MMPDAGAGDRDRQQRHRRAAVTDRIDERRRPRVAAGKNPERERAIEQPAEHDRSGDAANLEQRRQADRRLDRNAGVADDRRQPAVEEIQVEQVHEVDDPDQGRRHRAPVREQLRDDERAARARARRVPATADLPRIHRARCEQDRLWLATRRRRGRAESGSIPAAGRRRPARSRSG